MGILKTQGIVIKHTNLGEADRIITILTRHKGKIQAIAKGCRKSKSSLLSSSELFAYSEFVLFKGNNLYHVTQAEIRESFFNIRSDLLKLSYATFFLELAETVSDEEIPSERLFILLGKTLYYTANGQIPMGTLALAYQLKLMDISGFRPHLTRCVGCGNTNEKFTKFNVEAGGVVCERCTGADEKIHRINPAALECLKFLLNTEISRLNSIKIDNTIFNEIDKIIKDFVQKHLDKDFKSLNFLEQVKNNL